MAIQPIDLQTMFSQMDKVGKNQAVQREGQQIQEAIQQVQVQRKLEQDVQSVNQARDMGEEAGTVKDDGGRSPREEQGKNFNKKEEEAGEMEQEKHDLIRDPALGRNIDISG